MGITNQVDKNAQVSIFIPNTSITEKRTPAWGEYTPIWIHPKSSRAPLYA